MNEFEKAFQEGWEQGKQHVKAKIWWSELSEAERERETEKAFNRMQEEIAQEIK